MTKKQMLSIISLWFFTVFIFGLGFSWVVTSSHCEIRKNDIDRLTSIQGNLLISFHILDKKKKLFEIKTSLSNREELIKLKIENFKKSCRSKNYKKQFAYIIQEYKNYLFTKQVILQEKQNFSWIEEIEIPERPDVKQTF